jgi:hypothetical protein
MRVTCSAATGQKHAREIRANQKSKSEEAKENLSRGTKDMDVETRSAGS